MSHCPCPQLTAAQPSPPHRSGDPLDQSLMASLFCHCQDQTCPDKAYCSFGLSDKPTSSVEDIKHKPVAPQGIPPRYKTCLSGSQGQVSSCEWVFSLLLSLPTDCLPDYIAFFKAPSLSVTPALTPPEHPRVQIACMIQPEIPKLLYKVELSPFFFSSLSILLSLMIFL